MEKRTGQQLQRRVFNSDKDSAVRQEPYWRNTSPSFRSLVLCL